MIAIDMIETCAPNVAPAMVQQIIHVESRGDPLAININGPYKLPRKPRDASDAVALVKPIIARGVSVDLGLMQVNSRNLESLGYSVEEMFEPCTNIAAGAMVLTKFYRGAKSQHGAGQVALRAALSAYNTGSYTRGFNNGYVARYLPGQSSSAPALAPPDPFTAETTVFIRKEIKLMTNQQPRTTEDTPVFSRNINDADISGVQVEVDADEAERIGAFEETALSEEDAWAANADLDPTDTTPSAVQRAGDAGQVVTLPAAADRSRHVE